MDIKRYRHSRPVRTDYTNQVIGARTKSPTQEIIPKQTISSKLPSNSKKRLAYAGMVFVIIVSVIVSTLTFNPKVQALKLTTGQTNPASCAIDTGYGNKTWSDTGSATTTNGAGATSVIRDGSPTNLSQFLYCTNYGFSIPSNATILGVVMTLTRLDGRNAFGSVVRDDNVRLFKNGQTRYTAGTNKNVAGTWTDVYSSVDHGGTTDLWGQAWTAADINNAGFGVGVAAINTDLADYGIADVDSMSLTVYYQGTLDMSLNGYIWENDDEDQVGGDSYDENSQQAAGNTAITGVRQGERLTLRTQIKSSGTLSPRDLGLFYDKNNDGNFIKASRVKPVTADGICGTSNAWTCTDIATANDVGSYSSMAMSPEGIPYVSYIRDDTGDDLYIAYYVGSGGTGCATTTWTCVAIETGVAVTQHTSIAFNPVTGKPAMTYFDSTNSDLRFAEYVGDGTGTGCATTQWTCTDIEDGNAGSHSSLAFGPAGQTYVAFLEIGTAYLRIAERGGTGGADCIFLSTWECFTIDQGEAGQFVSAATDENGVPYVSWYDSTAGVLDLRVAYYDGDGTASGCTLASWTCTTVDATNDTGLETSLAFSPSNVPYVSYYDLTASSLRVAYFVTSGGNCDTTGGSDAWQCTTIDADNDVGRRSSLAFNPNGTPYISYAYTTGNDARVAYFVTSGGNCDTTGGSDAWQCSDVDSADGGTYTSLAFDNEGTPYVSYLRAAGNNLGIATFAKKGEISLTSPLGGTNNDPISESHADMTAYNDTTNRDDADCIGGGTFVAGRLVNSDITANIDFANGNCTEIAFVIDTSQAVSGATYRFTISSQDSIRPDKGIWTGDETISSYPTMTIASDTIIKASKGSEFQGNSCSVAAEWSCTVFDNSGETGYHSSSAVNPTNGRLLTAYYDNAVGAKHLRIAEKVDSGGTGCGVGDFVTCRTLDDTSTDIGQYPSVAFSADGVAYISYFDAVSGLTVAKYVGTGGVGCASGITDWTCTNIHIGATTGKYSSIAISPSGVPHISYYFDGASDNLLVAKYVGTGGTGCNDSTWNCTTVHATNIVGLHTSIGFAPSGKLYVSYYEETNLNLYVAEYVGSGGTGCFVTDWTCTLIEATPSVGEYTSIAFTANSTPYISYYDSGNGDLKVAWFIGSGGSTCAGGSAAWNCLTLDNTNTNVGQSTSIAFSPENNPIISYYDITASELNVAQYVGTGGTGCASGITDWRCEAIGVGSGTGTSISFSDAGVPQVSYMSTSDNYLRLGKPRLYHRKPIFAAQILNSGRSAGGLGFGEYRLSDGRSPRSNALGVCGTTVANNLGLCGLHDDGGHMDSITAPANERPYVNISQKFSSNAILPTGAWAGRSNIAPSGAGTAGDIKMQVYRFGTTNAWVDVATNNSSTNCDTDNCRLLGIPSGTISEYFEADGGNYWMHWRVWQYENTGGSETLKTDLFQLQFINKQMRHGKLFENNTKRVQTF